MQGTAQSANKYSSIVESSFDIFKLTPFNQENNEQPNKQQPKLTTKKHLHIILLLHTDALHLAKPSQSKQLK